MIPKTVYPSASSTTITEKERPTPKRIHVHVMDKDESMIERNNRETQNRHRQLYITFFSRYVKKKTLIIDDSILNWINIRGIGKGVQKRSKSGAKVLIVLKSSHLII